MNTFKFVAASVLGLLSCQAALAIGMSEFSAPPLEASFEVEAVQLPPLNAGAGFEALLSSSVIIDTGRTPPQPLPLAIEATTMPAVGSSGFTSAGQIVSSLGALQLNINAGPTLAAMPDAMAAFQRATDLWAARIADPITVTINADMADLGSPTIIGQANTVLLQTGYDTLRNAMVADAAVEPDDAIVGSLPTAAQFAAYMPSGFGLTGNLIASKANVKALGFPDIDSTFGLTDGTITFNTQFSFDYDNSDGVTAGTMDFETVAAHEIGHVLGFISAVDYVDWLLSQGQTAAITPYALDLFRFTTDAAYANGNPETPAEFETYLRWLAPGSTAITDQVLAPWGTLMDAEILMATGRNFGDGQQASHWKDNLGLGLMDPTLAYGEIVRPSEADFRAFDLIGWDILPIPEPGTLLLLLTAVSALAGGRGRRRRFCQAE